MCVVFGSRWIELFQSLFRVPVWLYFDLALRLTKFFKRNSLIFFISKKNNFEQAETYPSQFLHKKKFKKMYKIYKCVFLFNNCFKKGLKRDYFFRIGNVRFGRVSGYEVRTCYYESSSKTRLAATLVVEVGPRCTWLKEKKIPSAFTMALWQSCFKLYKTTLKRSHT